MAQIDDIQAAVNRVDSALNQQTFNAVDSGGNPITMGWTLSYTHSTAVGIDAKVSQLLGLDDKVNQAVTALTSQVQAQGSILQAAQGTVGTLTAKLDSVLAGLPPDQASGIRAELDALGKHLGLGTA
jgi:hypothetical protein